MIIGSEAVEIGKMLFSKHTSLFKANLEGNKKFHPLNQGESDIPLYFSYSKPLLVSSKSQLDSIKNKLSDDMFLILLKQAYDRCQRPVRLIGIGYRLSPPAPLQLNLSFE